MGDSGIGFRQRFFAWGIHQVMKVYEPQVAPIKSELFGRVSGRVVEIGPGTGPNLKYLPQGVHWTGVEYNRHMFKYLEPEAVRLGLEYELIEGSAMAMPIADESVDWVIGSLVLCSVPDPEQTLAEVRRILKPGGKYAFIEHVRATPGSWTEFVQQAIKPVWCCCADGCHPDRRSWEVIESAGFSDCSIDRFRMRFPVVSPHIYGVATR